MRPTAMMANGPDALLADKRRKQGWKERVFYAQEIDEMTLSAKF